MFLRIVLLLSGFAYFTVTQIDERPSIYSLHIQSHIKYRFSITKITSKIANPANVSREVFFDVDVPGKAFISNFSIQFDNSTYYARIEPGKSASDHYEEEKRKGEIAGLISTKPNEFNKFVVAINVAALKKITFNLIYEELLERHLGSYKHEISINPKQAVRDLQVKISIEETRPIRDVSVPLNTNEIDSVIYKGKLVTIDRLTPTAVNIDFAPSTIEQGDEGVSGKFIVKYDVERDYSVGEVYVVDGYFVHFFAPEVAEDFPRDIMFLLDTSTSMTDHKLGQMKDAMVAIIKDLSNQDRFNIMVFNNKQDFWADSFQPVTDGTKAKALRYVKQLRTIQYTDISGALLKAFSKFEQEGDEGVPMIFFLTDGEPTVSQVSPTRILRQIKLNNKGNIPIYSLALGSGADWNFMYRLSDQSGGLARRIFEGSSASLQIAQFYKEVSTVLLEDISIRYVNTSTQTSNQPNVFISKQDNVYTNGSELVMAGKLKGKNVTELVLEVQAQSKSGPVVFKSSGESLSSAEANNAKVNGLNPSNIIRRMWAYLTIKELLKKAASAERDDAAKSRAEDLALKYGFVTPVTSLVVVTSNTGLWKDYEEDMNDLHKRTPRPTIKPRPTRPPRRWGGGGGGGGGGWGGGGGDPHFMIGLDTLDYPLCFDVVGDKNQVYTLFKDILRGVTVNVRFDTGVKKNRNGGKRVYIKEAAILSSDQVVFINHDVIEIDNVKHTWDKNIEIRINNAWLIIDSVLKVAKVIFDTGLEAEVARRTHNQHNIGDDFINVEVRHEEHASVYATGLVGQFLKKNIELKRIRITDADAFIGHLKLTTGDGESESRAKLVNRHDPLKKLRYQCWMLRKQGLDNIVNPEKFLISDLFVY